MSKATIETNFGNIVFELFPNIAPETVRNFTKLAKSNFYDGTKFHRVMPGFMIQGGDPNTKKGDPSTWGTGGPGYTIPDEFSDIHHVKGIISMANTGAPNSSGSQFFIVSGDAGFLDGKYSAFGRVVSGLDVVDKIVNVPTKMSEGGEKSSPIDPPVLKSVKIVKWPIK